ncbi:protein of unknown function [Clostridium collagenovorans DSM 3089]|uniref:DUF4342 domain-containing protein n=1 Tax=Clostridium collagenovorans DSM 3089 TaxID=1121306 RepID=A0A1M5XPQ4_9CLOT|nr:DUF4342 domain-containing protein [Clostridium collagenovorans]SHI01815.1 protein of unknown function [Clostridium collagenovorans DSM 3089]
MEITLEKIDLIRERLGVSYAEAKEALVECDGNVVEALIYLEEKYDNAKSDVNSQIKEEIYTSTEEFKQWFKDLIRKGNLRRIKVKKDDKTIVDVPVNTGIAAGLIACIWTPIIVIGVATAVVAKLTIEITREDGSVEVVNAIIKNAVNETVDKFKDMKEEFKSRSNDEYSHFSQDDNDETIYTYTVKYDEMGNEEVEVKCKEEVKFEDDEKDTNKDN